MHQFQHNKLYLSISESRRAAMDMPVGDPFGGPAYGKRQLPAIMAIGGMFAAGSAFAAATTTLGAIMAGASFVGSALTLVGTISGNAKLTKIGSVLGLAGGIGMGADALLKGGNFTFSGGDAASAPEWLRGAKETLSMTPSVTPGTQATGRVDVQAAPDTGSLAAREVGGNTSVASANLNAPGAGAPSINTPGGATSALNAGPSANGPFTAQTGTGLRVLPGDSQAVTGPGLLDSLRAGNYMDAAKAAGSSIMDLAKTNPGAAQMLGNAATGVADWLSGKTDAEIAFLEARASSFGAQGDQIRFAIDREKQRRANLNAGYLNVNQSLPVNPNATIQMPWAQGAQQAQQPGLIAGVRG